MSETKNYKLYVTDDSTETFRDWRTALAGEENSNMTKIDEALSGKSDSGHKHSADDIDSGVLPPERGGTGKTTLSEIGNEAISGLTESEDAPEDGDYFVSGNSEYHRKPLSVLWGWIKSKTDLLYSALGHEHDYLPLEGGVLNGNLTVPTVIGNLQGDASSVNGFSISNTDAAGNPTTEPYIHWKVNS